MAWTHNVLGTESTGERLRVLVDYTDGATVVHGEHFTNSTAAGLNWLKGEIVRKLAELTALSDFASSMPTGAIDLTLPVPPAPEPLPLPIIKAIMASEDGTISMSADGIPQVNSIPAVDSKMACFCPSVADELSTTTPYVDYVIADAYVQLAGIELQVVGAELWDALKFQVVMTVGGNDIVVSEYGGKDLIIADWTFHFLSPLRSNAIPQGLKLRVAMTFYNSETTNKPKLSLMYHLWRPYAA